MSDFTAFPAFSLKYFISNNHSSTYTVAKTKIECIIQVISVPYFRITCCCRIMEQSVMIWNIFRNICSGHSCEIKRKPVSNPFTIITDQSLNCNPDSEKSVIRKTSILFDFFYRLSNLSQIIIVIQIKILPDPDQTDNITG